jgi:hypothetical protein
LEVELVFQDPRRSKTLIVSIGASALVFGVAVGWWMWPSSAPQEIFVEAPPESPRPFLPLSPETLAKREAEERANPGRSGLVTARGGGLGGSVLPPSIGPSGIESEAPTAIVDAPPVDSCQELRFRAEGKDAPRYGKNRISVRDERFNPKTVCVRVDGVPVKHVVDSSAKDGSWGLELGPVTKATSVVSVRYCTGKATCGESCVIPRDEFMEALAGVDDETAEKAAAVGWSGSRDESETEKKLERELVAFQDVTDDRLPGVYAKWTPGEAAPSCSTSAVSKTAQADLKR